MKLPERTTWQTAGQVPRPICQSHRVSRTQKATRNPVPSYQVIPTRRSRRARGQHDTRTPAGPVPTTPIPYTQLKKQSQPTAAEPFYSKLGLPKYLTSLTVVQDRRVNNKVNDIIANTHRHRLEPQRPTTSTYQDKDQAAVAISEMTDK
jgi:hypothetical protein